MATTTARYEFVLGAKNKTGGAFSAVSRGLTSLRKNMLSATSAITGLVGVAGMGALIKSSLDAGDKIQKLSIRLGVSTEALSQYKHVAELSGITFETMSMGWQRQTRRIAEAAEGMGEAKGALRELGLNAAALKTQAPEKQFEILADAFGNVDSQADKVRLAMKIWDSEGVSMLQAIEGGSAGLKSMRQEADDLNLTLTKDQANAMAEANDNITRMKANFTSFGNTLAVELGPAIAAVTKWLGENMPIAVAVAKLVWLDLASA
ncbi:MAG: hypothetical protein OEW37_00210, partial [Rhodospirillaceae bacterium]|nr:hypothetical protein [Rhodospirillaceae bacterium]